MSRTAADHARLTFVIVASLTALGVAAAAAAQGQAPDPSTPDPGAWPAPYAPPAAPTGFRSWRRVKSGQSQANALHPAGVHHIYANALAVEGYRSGAWPDGAVIAFEVVGAEAGQDPAGRQLRLDAMVRDRARYAPTGGWGYGRWLPPDGRTAEAVARDPARACHACHAASHPDDFVFSELGDYRPVGGTDRPASIHGPGGGGSRQPDRRWTNGMAKRPRR